MRSVTPGYPKCPPPGEDPVHPPGGKVSFPSYPIPMQGFPHAPRGWPPQNRRPLALLLVFRLHNSAQTHLLPSSHMFVGTDHLPVLFKVSHGREILVRPRPHPVLDTQERSREPCPPPRGARVQIFLLRRMLLMGFVFPAKFHRCDSEAGAKVRALHLH